MLRGDIHDGGAVPSTCIALGYDRVRLVPDSQLLHHVLVGVARWPVSKEFLGLYINEMRSESVSSESGGCQSAQVRNRSWPGHSLLEGAGRM
jgi:hypothetical protein